jgi:hypothetical protein
MSLSTALSDTNNPPLCQTSNIESKTNTSPIHTNDLPQPFEQIYTNSDKIDFNKDPQPYPSQFPAMTSTPLHSLEITFP